MKVSFFWFIFCFFLALSGITNFLLGQESLLEPNKSNLIEEIKLTGLSSIGENLVYFNIESQVNEAIDPRTVSEDIKRIFALGFFAKAEVDISYSKKDGLILTFFLTEKPTIRKIIFEGNSEISDTALAEKILVLPFQILDERKINLAVETIRREYIKKTYNATVTYKIEEVDTKFSILTFIIQEHPHTYLTDINIQVFGKKPEFYPLDLKRRMMSAEVDCFTWMKFSGIYEEDRINQDLSVFTRTYFERGYIRVSIDRPEIRLIHNPEFSRVEVDLKVTEGEQYFIGNIIFESIDNKEFLVSEEEFRKRLYKTGDIYNPLLNGQARIRIGDIYQSQGYAFAYVRIDEAINDETKKVDLKFSIFRGEKVYINRINLKGNNNTHDEVIRRQLTIYDDELFNGVKIRESQSNIQSLGFFSPQAGVNFENSDIPSENKVDYDVEVKESQTGTLRGALTFSNQFGLGLNGKFSKRNFRGYGQTISLSAALNVSNNQTISLEFIDPYFLGSRFTSSSSLNYTFKDGKEFDTLAYGFAQGFSYPVWKDWSISGTYIWNASEYENATVAGLVSLNNKTNSILSSVRFGLRYYTLDNPQIPSSGVNGSLFYTEAGGGALGGNELFREIDFTYQYFKSLSEDSRVVFMGKYNFSRLFSKEGELIPTKRRYRLGGPNDVRGFNFDAIEGATSSSEYRAEFDPAKLNDKKSKLYNLDKYGFFQQNRGGNIQSLFNFELLFPITREGYNLRGVVFYDIGNVWQDNNDIYEFTGATQDYASYRQSYGVGVRIITGAFGVIRFEYATKLEVKKGESANKFHFSIGSLF